MSTPNTLATRLTREHAEELLRLEAATLRRLRRVYEESRLQLRARLDEVPGDSFTAQQIRATLAQVQAGIAAMIGRLREVGHEALTAGMERAVEQTLAEIAFWEPQFGEGPLVAIRVRALQAIEESGLLLEAFDRSVQTYGAALTGQIQRRLQLHLIQQRPMRTVAIDIAGRLRTGLVQGERWRAERIVRTELANAANAGHQAVLEESLDELPGLKRQWDAHLDARTSERCTALDGQVVGIREPFRVGELKLAGPPAHPNCRSRTIPWHAEWERDAGLAGSATTAAEKRQGRHRRRRRKDTQLREAVRSAVRRRP